MKRIDLRVSGALLVLVALTACGGSKNPNNPTPVVAPPAPTATITAVGAGSLVVHPSMDSRYCCALEAPLRISETGGGTADWNYVRMQIIKGGREIERFELGATSISSAGYSRVAANSATTRTPILRLNSTDFDRIDLTLGFSDLKDARQFTVAVPFDSFGDVTLSFVPLFAPADRDALPSH
jgi:hypothetical protein